MRLKNPLARSTPLYLRNFKGNFTLGKLAESTGEKQHSALRSSLWSASPRVFFNWNRGHLLRQVLAF
jgi:hypothetical protein